MHVLLFFLPKMQEKSITSATKNRTIFLEGNSMMDTKSVKDKCSLELAILCANALNKGDGQGYTLLQRQTLLNNPKVHTVLLHTERPQTKKRTSYFRISNDIFFCRSVCIFQIYAGNTLDFW